VESSIAFDLLSQHPRLFITGTDTEVGKTFFTSLLVDGFISRGQSVFPFKPISAGVDENGVNEDAAMLFEAAKRRYNLQEINPIVFEPPIAPHIAAQQAEVSLNKSSLQDVAHRILHDKPFALIEGAGGWLLPLNDNELMSEWVADNNWPVVFVVGVKLGCLNHALLTEQSLIASGVNIVGWVANFIEGNHEIAVKNVEFLEQKLNSPLLFSIQRDQLSL
jgi:dethiobiotin synthetase